MLKESRVVIAAISSNLIQYSRPPSPLSRNLLPAILRLREGTERRGERSSSNKQFLGEMKSSKNSKMKRSVAQKNTKDTIWTSE
jgi:hypothetical protein